MIYNLFKRLWMFSFRHNPPKIANASWGGVMAKKSDRSAFARLSLFFKL